jgi:starch synthase
MRVLFAGSEIMPWSRTGGLAEVTASLPRALAGLAAAEGLEVCVVTPLYRETRRALEAAGRRLLDLDLEVRLPMGWRIVQGRFFELEGEKEHLRTVFLEQPEYFDREGIYCDRHFHDFGDNPQRFAFFSRALAQAGARLMGGAVDVMHLNDWQTALVPVFLDRLGGSRPRTVLTIHNLGYQGVFAKAEIESIGLDWGYFTFTRLEFWDRLCFMKGGIAFADAITTVSPSYAREILGPAQGFGLDGFLRDHSRKLSGILNGIDTEVWSPSRDPLIAARYSVDDLRGKARCRQALIEETGLRPRAGEPILAVVSRFAWQKGVDLVADLVPELELMGACLVVLGDGDPILEGRLRRLAAEHPGRLWVHHAFDNALAHRIEAGADIFLMPSRYEPCGLNQMYSMAYGTVPVVHAVGGLADTVVEASEHNIDDGTATGFGFANAGVEELRWALGRAVWTWREHRSTWQRIVRSAMSRDFSWTLSARRYVDLYRRLLQPVAAARMPRHRASRGKAAAPAARGRR